MRIILSPQFRDIGGVPLLALVVWLAACAPAAAEAPDPPGERYTFYLGEWTGRSEDTRLIPLEPETLQPIAGGVVMEAGSFSADGSTMAMVEYPAGLDVNSRNLDPEQIWIVVYDLHDGVERNRFHPPESGLIYDLSRGGRRLLLQPFPFPIGQYPPPVNWYVLDSSSGRIVAHIADEDNACWRQRAYLDLDGRRILCVVDPDLSEVQQPLPLKLAIYDVQSGRLVQSRQYPQILVGGSQRPDSDPLVWDFLEPALVLSPDGQLLAIIHADADTVSLIDSRTLAVERTIPLERKTAGWDWFGLLPAVAYAKGEMNGTIRQATFSIDGRLLYVFSQEVRPEEEAVPAERGLLVVDLLQGRVLADALLDYQVQWLRPAPDGTAYVFGTTEERLLPFEIRTTSPSTLFRLDGRTLDVLAERGLTGYHSGWIVVSER